jgi:hypothetical protein
MGATSKSPRKVLQVAYAVARKALPAYSHRFSPKKFTQPQLFAILVLKAFLKTDYRGVAAILADSPSWCAAIGLENVPHFTTIEKAEKRLLCSTRMAALLGETIRLGVRSKLVPRRVGLAAVDGTGFESRRISPYFVRRRKRGESLWDTMTYTRFPKAGILCDCRSHMVLAVVAGRGPGPDIIHLRQLLERARRSIHISVLLADAGYDSEASHVYCRERCGVRSIIPPKIGRPTSKPPSGRWRRYLSRRWDKQTYGQRWQVETVNSMIKRLLDSALTARSYWSQCREISLRAITLNVMILLAA